MIVDGERVNDFNFKPDDEPIPSKTVKFNDLGTFEDFSSVDLSQFLKLTLQSPHPQFQIPSPNSGSLLTTIPVALTITTHEPGHLQGQLPRVPIDLVCLIDKSGSMLFEGKMEQLKSTLTMLLDFLLPEDRLCLIEYDSKAKRLTNFRCVNEPNKIYFRHKIDQLEASGGTSIKDGLIVAKKVLEQRRDKNRVTGLFLLSDGEDPVGIAGMEPVLKVFEKEYKGEISVNTFGFGDECDEDLLSVIADRCGGLFYFMDGEEELDDMFCDCLGRMVSVLGKKGKMTVKLIPSLAFPEISFARTYGKDWKGASEIVREIDLGYVIAGKEKTFVCKINLPYNKKFDSSTLPKLIKLIDVQFTAESFLTTEEGQVPFEDATELSVELVHGYDPQIPINEDVTIHLLRVETAEAQETMFHLISNKKEEQARILHQEILAKLNKFGNKKAAAHPIYQNCVRTVNDMNMYVGLPTPGKKVSKLVAKKRVFHNFRNQMNCESVGNWGMYSNKTQVSFKKKMKSYKSKKKGLFK